MKKRKWTEDETTYLIKSREAGASYKVIANTLKRNEQAVREKAYRLNLAAFRLPNHRHDRRCHLSIPCRFLDPIRPLARAEGVSLARFIVNLIDQRLKEKH